MRWPLAKFEEVALPGKRAIVSGPFGSNIGSRFFVDEGIPVIRGNNLTFGERQFIDDGFVYLTEEKAREFKNCEAVAGDLVFTAAGTIGQVGIIPTDTRFDRYIISNKQLRVRCDETKVHPLFLFLWFTTEYMRQYLINQNRGCSIPLINLGTLRNLPVPLPPLKVQETIAATISTYDELIVNNRRRMALLEEAARQLYREWFVRLRFPGHEHTRITHGLPEGWERKPLSELCESIDYGYTASAEQEEIGPKFLRITDIVPNFIDWSAVPHCPIKDDRLEKFRLREGDIVIARTGATVGYAKRLHKRHPDAVFASYLVRLRLKPEVDNLMVGVFVESEDYKNYVKSRVGGAAQPNANAQVLAAAEILVPPRRVQSNFHDFVEPMVDEREIFQLQNQKLRAARDLLLPRLMSGEIAV
jgi:type I restriction enzyme S subunit